MYKKSMLAELEEMSKALEEPDAEVEELKTDPPSTESASTESPNTESISTDAPKTDAPTTDAPVEDERDKIIRELREKLAAKEAPKTSAPKTDAPATDTPISENDFLGDLDLDELTRDPSELNKLLNKVYKKAYLDLREEIKRNGELVVRSIPDIVKNNITLTTKLKKVHDKFYEENKDLVPWKSAVGTVMEELMAKSPDKSYEDLLPEVAKETRRRLSLKKDAVSKENNPPNLPRSKGGKRQSTKPEIDPIQQEFEAMDKALGLI